MAWLWGKGHTTEMSVWPKQERKLATTNRKTGETEATFRVCVIFNVTSSTLIQFYDFRSKHPPVGDNAAAD